MLVTHRQQQRHHQQPPSIDGDVVHAGKSAAAPRAARRAVRRSAASERAADDTGQGGSDQQLPRQPAVPEPSAARMVARDAARWREPSHVATLAMAVRISRMAADQDDDRRRHRRQPLPWRRDEDLDGAARAQTATSRPDRRPAPRSLSLFLQPPPGRAAHTRLSLPHRAHDRAGLGPAGVVDRRRLPRHPHARFRARNLNSRGMTPKSCVARRQPAAAQRCRRDGPAVFP